MRKFIISAMFIVAGIVSANADVIDDNLAKAEKSVVSAQKRLDAAKQCAANKPVCLAEMTAKAQKSADRANAKLKALTASAQ